MGVHEIIEKTKDPNIKPVLNKWVAYLNYLAENKNDYQQSDLWDYSTDIAVDLDIYFIALETDFFKQYPEVLNVQEVDTGTYIVKTAFNTIKNGQQSLNSIYNVVARHSDGQISFSSFLNFHTANWNKVAYGSATYFYNQYHSFNAELADSMNVFNSYLANFLRMPEKSFHYYIYNNSEERMRAKGFDYHPIMFNSNQETGEADINNFIIHAGNGKELYPHELVHLYTSEYHGTLHRWFDEGIAEYLDFTEHSNMKEYRHKLKGYFEKNQDINLSNLLSIPDNLCSNLSLQYDIGSLIVEKIYHRNGFDGIYAMLTAGDKDNDYYRTIEEQLQMERRALNDSIRNWLRSY